ncbi:mitotic spindle assembly checkpoint protein MAD1 [Phymastichus coffea]|uniref:mitotic spindle assembly checkpoint protein MAD1 n=1 Tax=Phymastichus coffea TaxID=108790 RepID=UPI00273C35BB|nr:mitotic spindle assembly checkpoint protein MAD1 [Phymastichus coffea]
MDNEKPSTSKIIKNLRSGTEALRRSSNTSFPLKRDSISSTNNDDNNQETPKKQKMDESSNGLLNTSEIPGSPWEWRRMKGEVITLKATIAHQDSTIKQLHKVRKEIEEICRKEKKLLEIQIEQDKSTIKQLELRVDIGRKTVQEAKTAQAHAERDLIQMKSKMEQKVLALVDDNNKLTEQLRQLIKQENKTETSVHVAKPLEDIEYKYELATKRIADLEVKLKEAMSIQQEFEVQKVDLQNCKIKVGILEAEKVMYEANKKIVNKVGRVCELENELTHAREIIASMRESVKGKLLLEEQMANVEERLKRTENLERQISQLEITQGELLSKISDYESIGISGGPSALRREINRLQQAEILLTSEEGQLRSQIDSLQKQLIASEQKHEETKKVLASTTNSQDRLTRFVGRLQKKLSLVTRERDSYREQLDTYEKEITNYQSSESTPNLLNERIPALERALEGYRDLVAKLEADLESIDGLNQREENKKLKDELEQLKGELEHRALKGDFNINAKILHFKFNPLTMAAQQAVEKQQALLQEVEQLRTAVGSGGVPGTPTTSSVHAQEIAELQQKHELKISRLKEAFKASSHEYRQTCYQLFGWRVDRTKEGQYKLSSQYAESPDDYLFFLVNEDGVNMVETPFSATLTTFIERHLQLQHSVPMFLNAVQSDLFDQQTMNVVS